jgi:hypothetical protein
MKRRIIVLFLVMILAAPAFSQTINFATLEGSFKTFSDDVAQSLPFAASATGLTWSDARVMGFPRFGVGVSVGAVTVPKEAFKDVATTLGFTLPSEISDWGIPLPGYTVDARMGIPFLPIDVGAKLGYLTPGMGESLQGATGISAEYLLAGLEVRYPILKGNLLMPALNVGVGYNYLNGSVGMTAGGLDDILVGGQTITMTDPEVQFAWKTHALDFNAQVSKGLLFLTPYLGAGYSYGFSQAGGGASTEANLTEAEKQALEDAGAELEEGGFLVYSGSQGGSLRAFGGLSFNIFILKLDVNAQYNFMTKGYGAGLNARIQI